MSGKTAMVYFKTGEFKPEETDKVGSFGAELVKEESQESEESDDEEG